MSRYTITGKLKELNVGFNETVSFVLQGDNDRFSLAYRYRPRTNESELKFLVEGRLNAMFEGSGECSMGDVPAIKLSEFGRAIGSPITLTFTDLGRPCVNQLINGETTILTVNSIDVKLAPSSMLGEVTFAYSEDGIND